MASSGILLIQSQVVSCNQFGSRIKHSCLRIYGELVYKGFSRSFYNLWRLHCTFVEIVRSSFTGRGDPSFAAAHLCQPKEIMINQRALMSQLIHGLGHEMTQVFLVYYSV